jgi:hypothetical protein
LDAAKRRRRRQDANLGHGPHPGQREPKRAPPRTTAGRVMPRMRTHRWSLRC